MELMASLLGNPDLTNRETYITDTTVSAAILPCYFRILVPLIFPGLNRLTHNPRDGFLLDFVSVILPLQFVVTFASITAAYLILIQLCLVIVLLFVFRYNLVKRHISSTVFPNTTFLSTNLKTLQPPGDTTRGRQLFNCVTVFRAYVNIFTVFCILAVDFGKVFPNYMKKAFMYGNGLMDTGVGCFTIANAVVSPEARNTGIPRWSSICDSVKSACILIMFGFLRLIVIRAFEYEVAVTEYGREWNFFFTLGVVKLMSTFICIVIPPLVRSILGFGIVAFYQYALLHKGLLMFVVNGSQRDGTRLNFLDANREGVVSCVGYLAMYLVGADLGWLLMRKRRTVRDLVVFTCAFVCFSVFTHWLQTQSIIVHLVSRRLANLSFFLWMISFNSMNITWCLILDVLVAYVQYHRLSAGDYHLPSTSSIPLQEAINYNGLLYFILANNLTGLFNLFTDTNNTGSTVAILALTLYMLVLSALMMILYRHRWSFKTFMYTCKVNQRKS